MFTAAGEPHPSNTVKPHLRAGYEAARGLNELGEVGGLGGGLVRLDGIPGDVHHHLGRLLDAVAERPRPAALEVLEDAPARGEQPPAPATRTDFSANS